MQELTIGACKIAVQLKALDHTLASASAFGVGTAYFGVSSESGTRSMLHQAGDGVEVNMLELVQGSRIRRLEYPPTLTASHPAEIPHLLGA